MVLIGAVNTYVQLYTNPETAWYVPGVSEHTGTTKPEAQLVKLGCVLGFRSTVKVVQNVEGPLNIDQQGDQKKRI